MVTQILANQTSRLRPAAYTMKGVKLVNEQERLRQTQQIICLVNMKVAHAQG